MISCFLQESYDVLDLDDPVILSSYFAALPEPLRQLPHNYLCIPSCALMCDETYVICHKLPHSLELGTALLQGRDCRHVTWAGI